MAKMTITEALAEIKTLEKRISKKELFVLQYLVRPDIVKDPHEDGSEEVIRRERQAIGDLRTRWVLLRTAIAKANDATTLTVGDESKSILAWLIWRREVSKGEVSFVNSMRQRVISQQKEIIGMNAEMKAVVCVDEGELAKLAENLETILGELDGKLSLLNATTFIEIQD